MTLVTCTARPAKVKIVQIVGQINSIKGVNLFLLRCKFMVPSFKNTVLICLEILFIQYFTIFSCKQYDVITDLICIIEKDHYL